jgi:hypothetical protein
MSKKTFVLVTLALVVGLLAVSSIASAGGATHYADVYDPNAMWLGPIRVLVNRAGYHFWFTPTASNGPYTAGHRYHNVYKAHIGDPSEWCMTPVPDRLPYNLSGLEGTWVYYKIFDQTMDVQVRPPCP